MILKSRSWTDGLGWAYFDNIRQAYLKDWGDYVLRIVETEHGDLMKVEQKDGPAKNQHFDKIFLQNNNNHDGAWLKLAVLEMTDGTQKFIAFNTESYLLSDDGKTVEKLLTGKIHENR